MDAPDPLDTVGGAKLDAGGEVLESRRTIAAQHQISAVVIGQSFELGVVDPAPRRGAAHNGQMTLIVKKPPFTAATAPVQQGRPRARSSSTAGTNCEVPVRCGLRDVELRTA